jgi:hypothetical protein
MPNVGAPELVIILLVWIAIPVAIGQWCSSVFGGKNRSQQAGFALGFLLTFFFSVAGAVIAVVIAYALGPGVGALRPHAIPPPTARATSAPRERSCVACGATLQAGAKFCGECGAKVVTAAGLTCPSCEADLVQGAKYCGECGASVVATPARS